MKNVSLLTHAAAAIIVTAILLAMYATVQQVHRTSANDPQMQLARDISAKISANSSVAKLLPDDTVDIAKSMATFVVLYDAGGNAIGSTGYLDGSMPQLPHGVFEFAKANMENDVTWQPRPGVRMAMVVDAVPRAGNVSYVAVGRSLQETEVRENNLLKMIFIVWAVCMAVIVMHALLQMYFKRKAIE